MKKYILVLIFICTFTVFSYSAMDFEEGNNGERVECGNVDLSSYDTASFCVWFIRESETRDARVFSNSYGSSLDQNWCLIIDDDEEPSRIIFRLRTTSDLEVAQYVDIVYNDTMHFFCCTYDGSNIRLYLDGVLLDTEPQTGNISNTDTPNTCIGVDGGDIGDRDFDGIIEDFRIYNRTLSQAEVTTIYNARGIDNIYHGLLHRWLLCEEAPGVEASGSNTVKDMVGQNHGTPQLTPVYIGSQLKFRRRLQ